MLLALKALQQRACVPVQNLRTMNPYVVAALDDWRQQHGHFAAIPRQFSPGCAQEVSQSPAANGQSKTRLR